MKYYLKKNSFTIILVCFLTGLLLCIPSQIKVSLVSKATISPRTFPYVAAVAALVCCVANLILEAVETAGKMKSGSIEETVRDENVSYLRIVACVALLFVWYLVLKRVGFIISTVVVMFVLSYMLGNRNKVTLVVFPVVFTLAVYLVFSQLLHVNLPEILF